MDAATSAEDPSAKTELSRLSRDALAMLDKLSSQPDGFNPTYALHAKAVVMLWGTKSGKACPLGVPETKTARSFAPRKSLLTSPFDAGLGLGGRCDKGFLLKRISHGMSPSVNVNVKQWSAPIFIKVRVMFGGLCFGYAKNETFMLAMSEKLLEQLESGAHKMFGIDQTFTIMQASDESKSDVIALSGGTTDLIVSNLVKGFMLDFSLAGGSMSLDEDGMKRIYGDGATAKKVINGNIPPPTEFEPLYARLNEMIEAGKTTAPSLTRVSLERMTGV
jgi:lipid-binding SYLF domain-containing protein